MYFWIWRITVLKLVFTLLKLNIHSMLYSMFTFLGGKNKEDKSHSSTFHIIIFCVLGIFLIVMFFFFFSTFMGLAVMTHAAKLRILYPTTAFLGSMMFAFMGTVLSSQSYLFEAKDNEHLLSMPIKPAYILISRFATLYSLNLLYSWLVLIPSLVVFAMFSGGDILGILVYFLLMLLLPLFMTGVSAFLGYIFYLISSRFPDKKTGNVVVGLSFFGLLVFGFMQLKPYAEQAFFNMDYGRELLEKYCYLFYMVGEAVTNHSAVCLFILVMASAGITLAVCFLISKRFVKILTTHREKPKTVYVEKPMKPGSPTLALLKKEVGYFYSNPGYVLNASFGTIFSLIFGIYLINNGYEFSGYVAEYVQNINSLVPLVILASLTLMSVMNDATAPSISLEAKTLWMLKTMPVDCTKILLIKSLLSPIITIPGVLILSVCSVIAVDMTAVDIIAMIVIPLTAACFSGLLGVCINLIFPRFDWTSEIIVIKQSASVVITLFSSVFISAFPFIFAIILPSLLDDFAIFWSYIIIWLYFTILCILGILFIKTKGRQLFNRL